MYSVCCIGPTVVLGVCCIGPTVAVSIVTHLTASGLPLRIGSLALGGVEGSPCDKGIRRMSRSADHLVCPSGQGSHSPSQFVCY